MSQASPPPTRPEPPRDSTHTVRDNPLYLPVLNMHRYQPAQAAVDSALGLHLRDHHVQSTHR
jgi:hypothetical protein